MKTLSTIIATLASLLLIVLAARYATGFWLFYTFASFQIQGAAIAFALALLAFLLHRHIMTLALMLIAAGIGIHGYIMLGEFRQPTLAVFGDVPKIKLLSTNIMGDNMANGARIADYITGSGADVVFIQESAPIGPEIDRIKAVYPYRLGCGAKTITCDQSLWSKTPFVSGDVFTASPIYRDRLMIASIDFGGTTVNFANVHLTKPYFDTFHAVELKKIRERLEQYKGSLVLAGDFNSSILTPDVRGFLKRTSLMTAEREPHTWPVAYPALGMAIDHVFVTDPLRIETLTTTPDPLGSNHLGLIADIILQDTAANSGQN
jgi:endonuclease/exonuclease/phosphatase (EEP) superfamily protein YafD